MKKIIAVLAALIIGVCVINAETDFFLEIDKYIPSLGDNYPEAADTISDLSVKLSDITDLIPTPREIIAMIKHEELPIDPADAATNAYIENSPMLSFYPNENISMLIGENNEIVIYGVTGSKSKSHLIVCFDDLNGENIEQKSISTDNERIFNTSLKIPQTDNDVMSVSVYTGSKAYGEFSSWVYNYVYIEKDENGSWYIRKSPVYDHNKEMYEKSKSVSEALKSTPAIQSDSEQILSIAEQLTAGIEDDYDKLVKIHDWVAQYIFYDVDSLSMEEPAPYVSEEVVMGRRAVCLGYANLYAALCRSISIPCNVVAGYALGVGGDTQWTDETVVTQVQNHAWNEAYVDGRWVIIDPTWGSTNKYENGEMQEGNGVNHLYFDANLEFFSSTHKILEYIRR